mgnify:CR=1 FL=1
MKTTYKNIISRSAKAACMGLALLCTSCLDFEPEAQMNDSNVWNSATNVQLFANQFYGWLADFQAGSDGAYMTRVNDGPHSDLRSDILCTQENNFYSAGTNSIPETDANYTRLYRQIYYTNLLLKKVEGFADKDAVKTPVAEAKFFRAYCYFELVQLYGDCILLTEPAEMDSPAMNAKRDDRGKVIDQCIKDLQEAADGLPDRPAEAGRLCKDAAWAMLSRVALYEGTWQKFHTGGPDATANSERVTSLLTTAKNAANEVMTRGNYTLFYNDQLGTDSYRYMFILEDVQCNPAGLTTADNTEYILANRHRLEDGIGLNITHMFLVNGAYPTRKLADMYRCQDGLPVTKSSLFKGYSTTTSEYENRDNRMLTTLAQPGEKIWNNLTTNCRQTWDDNDLARATTVKSYGSGYMPHKWGVERRVEDTNEAMDFPVIRYAEVLLNYAEAAYELDNAITDADLDKSLNLVRQRINPNMAKLSNVLVTSNGLNMREEIRAERTVELAFEGFRIDDLKRWYTASAEMPQDQLGIKWKGTQYETAWSAATATRQLDADGCLIMYTGRQWAEKNYLYPLPGDQRQLNPSIGQNPGWE